MLRVIRTATGRTLHPKKKNQTSSSTARGSKKNPQRIAVEGYARRTKEESSQCHELEHDRRSIPARSNFQVVPYQKSQDMEPTLARNTVLRQLYKQERHDMPLHLTLQLAQRDSTPRWP